MQRLVGDNVVYVKNMDAYFDLRTREPLLSDRAVRNEFCPIIPFFTKDSKKGPISYKPDPIEWLQNSPERLKRDVVGIAMHPGEGPIFTERGLRHANSFLMPVGCSAHPDTKPLVPKPAEREAWNWLWGCIESPMYAAWLKKFYAHVLKYPGVKIRSAPLLVSVTTGTGKTTLMNEVPRILFGHVQQLTEDQMATTFNGELLGAWWATIEEIYAGTTKSERRRIADKMKPWITNGDLSIHKKGETPFNITNRLQLTASSNHLDAMQIDDDEERRWGVGSVRERQWTPAESLSLYGDLLATERAPGVLKYLMQQESLTGFHASGRPPVTAVKRAMVSMGLGPWESTLLERMAACEPPFNRDVFCLPDVINQVIGLEGLNSHKLAAILRQKPFHCQMVLAGHRNKRMWSWRNHEYWKRTNEGERMSYMETGEPPRPGRSEALPAPIAAMRADAEHEEDCDLI